MKSFKKYTSIENHYQQKIINYYLDNYPEIGKEKFIATEKLDGANIQVYITPDEIRLGKRNSWIGESFNDIHNVVKEHEEKFDIIQKYCIEEGSTIRLFGEIYGNGIQKRIDYGKDKYISFFDIMLNDEYITVNEFMTYIVRFNLPTPKTYKIGTLQECLDINVEDKGEGIVIKPFNNYYSTQGSRFVLKKKSEAFRDIKAKVRVNPTSHPLNEEFRAYITDNRVKDVFSKYGEIECAKQISEYIKYVLEDAKDDFIKNTNFHETYPDLDDKEKKLIFNVGGSIVALLKKYL